MTCVLIGPIRRLAAAALALLVIGCDSSGVGKTVPVVGKVTVNGETPAIDPSLQMAHVIFRPDKTKGNSSDFEPTGSLDEKGTYTLYTNGKKGAPPGWYRVVVVINAPPPGGRNTVGKRPGPVSLIDRKYNFETTSGLSKEVVENPSPGAYDLAVTKSEQKTGSGR